MKALLAPVVFLVLLSELRNVTGLASVLGAVPATPAVLTKQRAVPAGHWNWARPELGFLLERNKQSILQAHPFCLSY